MVINGDIMREFMSIYVQVYMTDELLTYLRKKFPYHHHDFLYFVAMEYLKETNPCKQESASTQADSVAPD